MLVGNPNPGNNTINSLHPSIVSLPIEFDGFVCCFESLLTYAKGTKLRIVPCNSTNDLLYLLTNGLILTPAPKYQRVATLTKRGVW
jgi:hypothetical protein